MTLRRKRQESFKKKSFQKRDIKKMIRREERFQERYGLYRSYIPRSKKR